MRKRIKVMMIVRKGLICIFVLTLLSIGFSKTTFAPECETDADCQAGQICQNNSCIDVECISDADCGPLQSCVDNICDRDLDVAPNTLELVSYQASDYRFQVINDLNTTLPSEFVGFEQPDFDDSAFSTGSAAFGSGGECSVQQTVQTSWPVNSQLLVRRVVSIPAGATNVRIMVSIDNDIIGVFFNGTPIAVSITHDVCPVLDEFRIEVPRDFVHTGRNLVAFHVLDRGDESFFDTRILADITCGGSTPTILGTEGDDFLPGTEGPDIIHGLGGNDIIRGFKGDDRICGSNGNDILGGGDGNDSLFGQKGRDALRGLSGNDILKGGDGDDSLDGGDDTDTCDGGSHTFGDNFLNCEMITDFPNTTTMIPEELIPPSGPSFDTVAEASEWIAAEIIEAGLGEVLLERDSTGEIIGVRGNISSNVEDTILMIDENGSVEELDRFSTILGGKQGFITAEGTKVCLRDEGCPGITESESTDATLESLPDEKEECNNTGDFCTNNKSFKTNRFLYKSIGAETEVTRGGVFIENLSCPFLSEGTPMATTNAISSPAVDDVDFEAVGSPQPAQAQSACRGAQITNTTGSFNVAPSINAAGTRITFQSNVDGNRRLFLWDAKTGIKQIAQGQEPSINSDGTRIAFTSTSGSRFEIFLFDARTGITQITNTSTSGLNEESSINSDGTRIAFTSTSDGSFEIFLWDERTGIRQITNTEDVFNVEPSINSDGTRIAFASTSDGNREIFLFDARTGITQVTHTDGGGSGDPSINSDGTRIAFSSNRDLTETGSNVDGNPEIFLWDERTGISQITNTEDVFNVEPSINSEGTRIAFASTSDGNREIFLFDARTGITQITHTDGGVNRDPSINAAGTSIALESDRDANFEIFLVEDRCCVFNTVPQVLLRQAGPDITQRDLVLEGVIKNVPVGFGHLVFPSRATLLIENDDNARQINIDPEISSSGAFSARINLRDFTGKPILSEGINTITLRVESCRGVGSSTKRIIFDPSRRLALHTICDCRPRFARPVLCIPAKGFPPPQMGIVSIKQGRTNLRLLYRYFVKSGGRVLTTQAYRKDAIDRNSVQAKEWAAGFIGLSAKCDCLGGGTTCTCQFKPSAGFVNLPIEGVCASHDSEPGNMSPEVLTIETAKGNTGGELFNCF